CATRCATVPWDTCHTCHRGRLPRQRGEPRALSLRFLVDDGIPRFLGVLTLGFIYKWPKRSARMGLELMASTAAPVVLDPRTGKPAGADDRFFAGLNDELADKGFLVTAADDLIVWARTGSLMWMQFGLACCAIEMIQMSMPRYDAERFG